MFGSTHSLPDTDGNGWHDSDGDADVQVGFVMRGYVIKQPCISGLQGLCGLVPMCQMGPLLMMLAIMQTTTLPSGLSFEQPRAGLKLLYSCLEVANVMLLVTHGQPGILSRGDLHVGL